MSEGPRKLELAAALAPLLAFWLLDLAVGAGAALAVGLVFGAVVLGWRARATGRVDRIGVIGLVLLVGLGVPSWLSGDDRVARLAPLVGDVLFAGALVIGELTGRSLIAAAAKEADPSVDLDADDLVAVRGLSLRLAANFALHAVLVAWAADDAARSSLVNGPVQWAMLGAQVVGEVVWARARPRTS